MAAHPPWLMPALGRHDLGTGPLIIAICMGAAVLVMAVRTLLHLRRRARLLGLTERVTRAHAKLLSVKQKQLVRHDGYGNHDLSGWIAHANYFIDSVILRDARAKGIDVTGTAPGESLRVEITRRFLAVVNLAPPSGEVKAPARAARSGHDYEALCHSLLEGAGWAVSTTPMSGDQGADLIADAAGQRVVLQCKFHAKPVGNKAVQEAYTARNLHGADHAVVVSNNSFTRSAIELARANDVLLLHHEQLSDLGRQIAASQPKTPGKIFDARRPG